VILRDLSTPELGGPALYRELERRDPQLCRRVAFLTGDTMDPQVREFLDGAGRLCLHKPFDLDEVRRVVRQASGT